MKLADLKKLVKSTESELDKHPYLIVDVAFERDDRKIHVGVTSRLYKKCRKGRIWNSKPFLTALKNAQYGFDENQARSVGGRDGIYLVDRDYRPRNEMQRKLFDQYLDKADSGIDEVVSELGITTDDLRPIRIVSHHMRLLGVLWQDKADDWLILVDYDKT